MNNALHSILFCVLSVFSVTLWLNILIRRARGHRRPAFGATIGAGAQVVAAGLAVNTEEKAATTNMEDGPPRRQWRGEQGEDPVGESDDMR